MQTEEDFLLDLEGGAFDRARFVARLCLYMSYSRSLLDLTCTAVEKLSGAASKRTAARGDRYNMILYPDKSRLRLKRELTLSWHIR